MESTIRGEVLRLRAADPQVTATMMAEELGVSREAVRQILVKLGLPTKTGKTFSWRRRRGARGPMVPAPPAGFTENCSRPMRGAWAELLVAVDLIGRGYEIFTAAYGSSSCDMLALREGKTLRVEVKLGQWNGSKHTASINSDRRKSFDLLAIVARDGKEVRYLPELPAEAQS